MIDMLISRCCASPMSRPWPLAANPANPRQAAICGEQFHDRRLGALTFDLQQVDFRDLEFLDQFPEFHGLRSTRLVSDWKSPAITPVAKLLQQDIDAEPL